MDLSAISQKILSTQYLLLSTTGEKTPPAKNGLHFFLHWAKWPYIPYITSLIYHPCFSLGKDASKKPRLLRSFFCCKFKLNVVDGFHPGFAAPMEWDFLRRSLKSYLKSTLHEKGPPESMLLGPLLLRLPGEARTSATGPPRAPF